MNTLESLCDNIFSGQILTRVEASKDATDFLSQKAITPKAIENGEINHSEIITINLKKKLDVKKITIEGDIVIKLSTPYESALITKKDEGLLVTSFCAIIRGVNKNYDNYFINAFLNTNHVRKILKYSTTGLNTPLLRINNLKNLEIPKINLNKQLTLSQTHKANIKKIQILKELIINSEHLSETIILSKLEEM